jgi:hypothetical protein
MNTYGLSILEIEAMIQRVLLPNTCRCEVTDGLLSLTLASEGDPSRHIQIANVRMDSLNSARAIAELIGKARYLLALEVDSAKQRGLNTSSKLSISTGRRR